MILQLVDTRIIYNRRHRFLNQEFFWLILTMNHSKQLGSTLKEFNRTTLQALQVLNFSRHKFMHRFYFDCVQIFNRVRTKNTEVKTKIQKSSHKTLVADSPLYNEAIELYKNALMISARHSQQAGVSRVNDWSRRGRMNIYIHTNCVGCIWCLVGSRCS